MNNREDIITMRILCGCVVAITAVTCILILAAIVEAFS